MLKLSESIIVDGNDTSPAPFPTSTLQVVRQTNGVLRIHANNGGYLFSLVRNATDGKVYAYVNGFGGNREPKEVSL